MPLLCSQRKASTRSCPQQGARYRSHRSAKAPKRPSRSCAGSYGSCERRGGVEECQAPGGSGWLGCSTVTSFPDHGRRRPWQVIDTALVMKVLEPIWPVKAETANRVRV